MTGRRAAKLLRLGTAQRQMCSRAFAVPIRLRMLSSSSALPARRRWVTEGLSAANTAASLAAALAAGGTFVACEDNMRNPSSSHRADSGAVAVDRSRLERPIIIDTDAGWDDIATFILLAGLSIEPRLVTVGHGMLPVPQGAAWVRATLDSVGLAAVPVVAGGMGPLKEEPWRPQPVKSAWPEVQEAMDSTFAAMMPGQTLRALAESATMPEHFTEPDAGAHAILAAAREAGSVDILALGSLTNLARAMQLDPESFRSNVHRIVFIGDTGLCGSGLAKPCNVIVDPLAFGVLLESGIQIFCIGIRAYPHLQAPYSRQNRNPDWMSHSATQLPALWRDCTGTAASAEMLRRITAVSKGNAVLYDPLAVAFLLQPGMFAFKEVKILLAADGHVACDHNIPAEYNRGSTICQGRALEAQSLDWKAYRDFLLEAMNQHA